MIQGHEKFRIPDENKINDLLAEVNWNIRDRKTNECKVIRFTFKDGTEAYVKKEHLHAILFTIGNEEEQKKLIPQKITRVKWYETVLSVKATKDIHKGENITFPIKLTIPATEEDVIGEIKREERAKLLTGRSNTL